MEPGMSGKAMIIDGKVMIPDNELNDHFKMHAESHMVNLENLGGYVSESDYIERELDKLLSEIKSHSRITKFTGLIEFCDEKYLQK